MTKTTRRRASASRTEVQQPRPKQLTVAEARRLFDDRARHLTGMSGEEFRREYEAGRLDRENSNVLLAMLLPFGR